MPDPKRILILTADVGFGHRSAANAIAAALQETRGDACDIEIVNPLDDERTPSFLRNSQSDYDNLVREMPELYRLRYQISDTAVPNAIFESIVTVSLFNIIRDILVRNKPDVVISTHPMFPAPLSAVIAVKKFDIPCITVVTDLIGVHRLWFNPAVDLCLTPTAEAREEGLKFGLADEQVLVTGVPVHPNLNGDFDPISLRRELGWREDLRAILVVGSKRIKNLMDFLHVLNHSALTVQMILIAGGDEDLYHRFMNTEWHGVVQCYNYVDNMPAMLRASDCVISKAGGLIITEALACGLPLLLVDVTPGQELGNAEYVIGNGGGEFARSPLEALEILFHWFDNGALLLSQYQQRASTLGRPESAYTVADLVWGAAGSGYMRSEKRPRPVIPAILELLNSFGVNPDEDDPAQAGDITQKL
jgi:1,2-diacylglycerol 3-beta-galactosyltransferase